MRRTAVYRDDLFLEHRPGADHLDSPERLKVIYDALDLLPAANNLIYPSFSPAAPEVIGLIHSSNLIRKVEQTARRSCDFLDADTRTSARSYEAACLAAGSLLDGIRRIAGGEVDNAFCLVRPPGHHAERDRAMGFCIFNSIAIAAAWALAFMDMERILIIDWDLHHGNGTQKSFYGSRKVLFFSTHQYPLYPGTGTLPETGEGEGEGFTLNVPMPGGQGNRDYLRIFEEVLVPVAMLYQPDFILVSCGFDIYGGDPLGTMRVTPAGFAAMTGIVQQLASAVCQGRLLITLEGGYNMNGLRDGTLAVLSSLCGRDLGLDSADSATDGGRDAGRGERPLYLQQAVELAKCYWNM